MAEQIKCSLTFLSFVSSIHPSICHGRSPCCSWFFSECCLLLLLYFVVFYLLLQFNWNPLHAIKSTQCRPESTLSRVKHKNAFYYIPTNVCVCDRLKDGWLGPAQPIDMYGKSTKYLQRSILKNVPFGWLADWLVAWLPPVRLRLFRKVPSQNTSGLNRIHHHQQLNWVLKQEQKKKQKAEALSLQLPPLQRLRSVQLTNRPTIQPTRQSQCDSPPSIHTSNWVRNAFIVVAVVFALSGNNCLMQCLFLAS